MRGAPVRLLPRVPWCYAKTPLGVNQIVLSTLGARMMRMPPFVLAAAKSEALLKDLSRTRADAAAFTNDC